MFAALDARHAALRARYAEPHRAYHTEAHVRAMLAGLAELGAAVTHPDAVELAIWYHDAVYDPAAADNEARSEALLRAEMAGLADEALLAHAGLMIRLSATHALTPDVPDAWRGDCALFLDLDMAVLGAAPAQYAEYERGIAAEYVPVHGEAAYRRGRAAFLRASLDRPRVFLSDQFHASLDAPARANMAAALAGL